MSTTIYICWNISMWLETYFQLLNRTYFALLRVLLSNRSFILWVVHQLSLHNPLSRFNTSEQCRDGGGSKRTWTKSQRTMWEDEEGEKMSSKPCRVRTMNREALREMNKKRMKPNRKESMTSCTDSKQKNNPSTSQHYLLFLINNLTMT